MAQQRSEETHAKILSVAENLFAAQGYDATGIAEICSAAKVSKGAFYHHFPSKQAVFQALLQDWLVQLDQLLANQTPTIQDVPAYLLAAAGNMKAVFEGAPQRTQIIFEFWMQSMRNPEIWPVIVEPYHRYLAFFTKLLDQGKSEGTLSASLDSANASRILIALALGNLLQAFFDPQGAHWDDVTRDGVQTLLKGMRDHE